MNRSAILQYLEYLRHAKNQQVKDWALIEDFDAGERAVRDRYLQGNGAALPLRGTGVLRWEDDPTLQTQQKTLLALIDEYYFQKKPFDRENAAEFFKKLLALREELI